MTQEKLIDSVTEARSTIQAPARRKMADSCESPEYPKTLPELTASSSLIQQAMARALVVQERARLARCHAVELVKRSRCLQQRSLATPRHPVESPTASPVLAQTKFIYRWDDPVIYAHDELALSSLPLLINAPVCESNQARVDINEAA